MSQVILVEPTKELRELIALNLRNVLGCDVIERESAEDVVAILNLLPSVELIISTDQIEAEQTAHILASHIQKSEHKGKLIILGELPPLPGIDQIATQVLKGQGWEEVIQVSTKLLGIDSAKLTKSLRPDYFPVPATYFFSLDTCCCDVFIRIKKSSDEYQYVKRIHKTDTFQREDIERYISGGLENFYIQHENESQFINYLSNILVYKLENKENSLDQSLELLSSSHDIAINEVLKLGFNSATIQLTESIIDSMLDTFKKSKEISPLLRKIINSKGSFNYIHAHLTSIVAGEILKNLAIDKKYIQKKMAYAAFFKDAYLFHHDSSLQKITTEGELDQSELDQDDYAAIVGHALDAAELVKKYNEINLGVDHLILQHHGSSTGIGFHQDEIENLDRESQIFIFASSFVDKLLYYRDTGVSPKPIINDMKQKYPGEKMAIIVNALEKTLKKK